MKFTEREETAMPDNKPLDLSENDRLLAVDEITKSREQLRFMAELLKNGDFRSDECRTHMALMRHAYDSLSQIFKTDVLSGELERAYTACQEANNRISQLEAQLGAGVTASASEARLREVQSWFETWYQLYGLHYVTLQWFAHGLQFETSDQIDKNTGDPENITFGDRQLAIRIKQLVPYGMVNYDKREDTFHDNLLDTEANRNLLSKTFRNNFPNVRIHGFESCAGNGSDMFLRMKGFIPWSDIENWHTEILKAWAAMPKPENCGRYYVEKAAIESRLASKLYTGHAGPGQIQADRDQLKYLRDLTKLWDDLCDMRRHRTERRNAALITTCPIKLDNVTVGKDTVAISFPAGARWAQVEAWLEKTFNLDIKRDLAGEDAKEANNSHDGE